MPSVCLVLYWSRGPCTVAAGNGTLYRVEEGDAGVSLATYASVLRVLGLQGDLDLVARDDVLGRKLQDLNLPTRKVAPRRASRKNSAADANSSIPPAPSSP